MRTWPQKAVAGLLAGLALLACQERLVDSAEEELYKFCAHVNGARVFDEEGELASMVSDPRGGHTPVCRCLTLDEFNSSEYDDEVNDEAYEVCLANAARMGYPEANDCAYWHGIHHWGDVMFSPFPSDGPMEVCSPEDSGGCSLLP